MSSGASKKMEKLSVVFEPDGAQANMADHWDSRRFTLDLLGSVRESLDVSFTTTAHVKHVATCNPDGVRRAASAL